jgi:hypothetical protein
MKMAKPYALTEKESFAVASLDGAGRFAHFIKRVADSELVWGLRNASGWVSAADDLGNMGFPVWPHADYAAACAIGEWADTFPQAVNVGEFVEDWLPDMEEKGVAIIVFPTAAMRGVMMNAQNLAEILKSELAQYE